MDCLATKLIRRGDTVSIERGRLVIQPASGKPVPPEWIAANTARLCREVLMAVGIDAFEYTDYSTGHYGKTRSAGVTLRFVSVVSGQSVYAVFNADLTRQRNTATAKAGAPLPKGQFRIGKRSHLYKFWLGTGLPFPRRLAAMHDYMGKLRGILLTGALAGDRIGAGSLAPIDLTVEQFREAILPDNSRTRSGQLPDSNRTRVPDKESAPAQSPCGLQRNQTACVSNHENKLTRRDEYEALPITQSPTHRPPEEQSVDEWLEAYSSN